MLNVTVTVSEAEVKRRLGILANKSGVVISRAANRAITTGKMAIKQETAKIYNVNQKDVDKILKVEKATTAHPTVHMSYRDAHSNLFWFGSKQSGTQAPITPRYPIKSSSPYDPDPEYVKAKVMTGRGAVILGSKPKPFVQIAKKSGVIGLFQRVDNSSRASIRGVAAPALPQVIKNEEVIARFNRDVSGMFIKRLNHEIDQILKGKTR